MMDVCEMRAALERDGYFVCQGLFSPVEAATYRDHFMDLRHSGSWPGDFDGVGATANDPLRAYPRMIHMHRWDPLSLAWVLDPRIAGVLEAATGASPYAVQTMLYFKPPGARGQALHQDQKYLRAQPGTCVAAWMALDACDEANGCLQVVPGSHKLPLLCPQRADTTQSFTDVTVPVPADMAPVPVLMAPGDVLVFHGLLIHGSFPNTTSDRFRRSLIGHYLTGDVTHVAPFYHPILRMDGSVVELAESLDGGPCGVLVNRDGVELIEMREEKALLGPEHE